MQARMIIPPSIEPVSLEKLKSHLRIVHSSDDEILSDFITLARESLEQKYQLALITQSWRFEYDLPFPPDGVCVHFRPVQSIDALNIINELGDERLIASSNYLTSHDYKMTRLVLRNGLSTTLDEQKFALTTTLGYGDQESDIPAALKQAIILIASAFYEGRFEDSDVDHKLETLKGLKILMSPFLRPRLDS